MIFDVLMYIQLSFCGYKARKLKPARQLADCNKVIAGPNRHTCTRHIFTHTSCHHFSDRLSWRLNFGKSRTCWGAFSRLSINSHTWYSMAPPVEKVYNQLNWRENPMKFLMDSFFMLSEYLHEQLLSALPTSACSLISQVYKISSRIKLNWKRCLNLGKYTLFLPHAAPKTYACVKLLHRPLIRFHFITFPILCFAWYCCCRRYWVLAFYFVLCCRGIYFAVYVNCYYTFMLLKLAINDRRSCQTAQKRKG